MSTHAAAAPRRIPGKEIWAAFCVLEPRARLESFSILSVRIALGLMDLVLAVLLYRLFVALQVGGTIAQSQQHKWMAEVLPSSFNSLVIASLIAMAIRLVGEIASQHWLNGFIQRLYTTFLIALVNSYLHMRWTSYVQRNRSELTKHCLTTALDASYSYFLIIELVSAAVVVGVLSIASLWMGWIAALILFSLAGGLLLLHRLVLRSALQSAGDDRERAFRALQVGVAEVFQLAKEIRVYRNQEFFRKRIEREAHDLTTNNARLSSLPQMGKAVVEHGTMMVFVAVIFIASKVTADVTHLISLLVFYFVLARRILPSISQMFMVMGQLDGAFHNIRIINTELQDTELESTSELSVPLSARSPSEGGGVVDLHNVSFSYPDGTTVLSKVSLLVAHGECVVLRGPSGTGKSSLLNVIAGLLPPSEGSVAIVSRENGVAYVPQEVVLLDDTVRANVVFGLGNVADDSIVSALGTAQLDDFILSLPLGLETRIGDNGVLFSGGQRQRLGIARAVLRQPDLLLLDEATAALDTEKEARLLASLRSHLPRTAIVLVTHRTHAANFADRILHLQNGKLMQAVEVSPSVAL